MSDDLLSKQFRDELRAAAPEVRQEVANALASINAEQRAAADKDQEAFGRKLSRMTWTEYQNWMRENGFSGTQS